MTRRLHAGAVTAMADPMRAHRAALREAEHWRAEVRRHDAATWVHVPDDDHLHAREADGSLRRTVLTPSVVARVTWRPATAGELGRDLEVRRAQLGGYAAMLQPGSGYAATRRAIEELRRAIYPHRASEGDMEDDSTV